MAQSRRRASRNQLAQKNCQAYQLHGFKLEARHHALLIFLFPAIKRVYATKKISNDLDIPFYPNGDKSLFEHLQHFHLFTIGHKSKIKNMLHQEDNETEIAFLDFTYILDTGGGGDIPVIERQQSILYLCSPKT